MFARLLLFASLPFVLSSQERTRSNEHEAGLPYLRDYTPREYRAQSQNWSVTQDQRVVIYIGNNDGVLIYDGVRWHTIRVANGSAVHSLDVDSNGVVYVGAHREFGYLAPDEFLLQRPASRRPCNNDPPRGSHPAHERCQARARAERKHRPVERAGQWLTTFRTGEISSAPSARCESILNP